MPVLVPAVRDGAFLTPQYVPANAVALRVAGASYSYDTTDDFFLPDIPARLGSNVFNGSRQIDAKFAGMHYHTQLPTVRYGTGRNVDCPGCLWSQVEAAGKGLYQWAALDSFVAAAHAANRDLVFCLMGTPTWASARPTEPGHYAPGGDAEPARTADLGDFAAAVCLRYLGMGMPIKAFEVWNEPKYQGHGTLAQGNYFTGTPQALAQMAREVFRRVKAIDSSVLVLSPSATGLEYPWAPGDESGTEKLNQFLAADDGAGGTGRDWIDAVAFHAYSHDGSNNLWAIPQMFANVRNCLSQYGLEGREIWVTETSAITPTLDSFVPQHQQQYIARTLLLAAGAGAARLIWYAWDDALGFHRQPEVASHWNEWVGLLSGATITVVNALRNRQVAAVVNGQRLLV